MNSISKNLDILFHLILPERILPALLDPAFPQKSPDLRTCFQDTAESALGGYSENEQALFFQNVQQACQEYNGPPFHLLAEFADEVLEFSGSGPLCRFGSVLDWREAYLALGQDMIVVAWLAERAVKTGRDAATGFTWPAVLHTDYAPLEALLREGVAENHSHLYGSSQYFALTWSRLMSYPEILDEPSSEGGLSKLENLLLAHASRSAADAIWPPKKRLLYAALLRALLFEHLIAGSADGNAILCDLRLALREIGYITAISRRTARLRRLYGYRFPQPPAGESSFCLDYAFTKELLAERDDDYRILAGERLFLYKCFRQCFAQKNDAAFQWIFYAYLLLKSSFRTELIQSNKQVGFSNFQRYDRRKYDFWLTPYWNEAHRIALNANLRREHVTPLEQRISPKDTMTDDFNAIYELDAARTFYDQQPMPGRETLRSTPCSFAKDAPCFFVLHFVKEKEPDSAASSVSGLSDYLRCRQLEKRKSVRRQAIALADALCSFDYLNNRIYGIDACSNEIGCRPEVFAMAFRFLRDIPAEQHRKQNALFCRAHPRLSVTYHAGEDFLDLPDGLRAIDETIHYLNFRRGDRIGHALALGVDPALHYHTKHGEIITTRQDRLDDLVWLCCRADELHIPVPQELRTQAQNLLRELYETHMSGIPWRHALTVEDYYHSWMLRGDDPARYRICGRLSDSNLFSDDYASFGLNNDRRFADLDAYRRDEKAVVLYWYYHYSRRAKLEGKKTTVVPISDAYLQVVGELQQAMRAFLANEGIEIECNPSSNVSIGTFRAYQEHPLLRFYTQGLDNSAATQLHTTINSDDQGIFDTSLPFEYALIAATLTAKTDADGKRVYSDQAIMDYLRNLQRNGREQSFQR